MAELADTIAGKSEHAVYSASFATGTPEGAEANTLYRAILGLDAKVTGVRAPQREIGGMALYGTATFNERGVMTRVVYDAFARTK